MPIVYITRARAVLESHMLRKADAQVVRDPKLGKSGTYWSWNNESESFENQVSEEVSDGEKGRKLYDLSMKLLGLQEQA